MLSSVQDLATVTGNWRNLEVWFLNMQADRHTDTILHTRTMTMMMMGRFVECIINGPQTRCQSAKQVGIQMLSERQWPESCGSQGGW